MLNYNDQYKSLAFSIPTLDVLAERDLLIKSASGDVNAREQLILSNLDWAWVYADRMWHYFCKIGIVHPHEELVQEANVAVIEGINSFDISKRNDETGEMLRLATHLRWVMRNRFRKYNLMFVNEFKVTDTYQKVWRMAYLLNTKDPLIIAVNLWAEAWFHDDLLQKDDLTYSVLDRLRSGVAVSDIGEIGKEMKGSLTGFIESVKSVLNVNLYSLLTEEDQLSSINDESDGIGKLANYQSALNDIPYGYEIVKMHILEDKTFQQISHDLKIPHSTAHLRYKKALQIIRDMIILKES